QADRDAIALPEGFPVAASHCDPAHGAIRSSRAQVALQLSLSLLIRDMPAGVDVADATPRRQPDVPDPPGRLRGRNGVGSDRGRFGFIRHLDGKCRIAEEDVAALLERDAQSLPDQQGLEPGSIYEQVRFDLTALLHVEASDVA